MSRFYAPYTDWECYKNGMYGSEVVIHHIEQSKQLLSNRFLLHTIMMRVVNEWPVSTRHNFTNVGSNCKSWLGQAACCLSHGAIEHATRMAWNELDKDTQMSANTAAKQVIDYWDLTHKFNRKNYGKEIFGH